MSSNLILTDHSLILPDLMVPFKHTKGIQKVRSFWGKMTSQTKKFVVMIKLTIIEVSTKNIMFNLFLVSFLEFFKHQYPT